MKIFLTIAILGLLAGLLAVGLGLPGPRAWRAAPGDLAAGGVGWIEDRGAAAEGPGDDESAGWLRVAPGLEIARFDLAAHLDTVPAGGDGEPEITVVRVDPRRWELRLLAASAEPDRAPRSARQWCRDRGLVAAINAGMFLPDRLTHAGYLRLDDHLNNPTPNRYRSAAALQPRRPGLPPFRIVDLEERSLKELARDYRHVAQNLRLVRRPRENRWSRGQESWSEAALGEDAAGRALLIYSRNPLPVYELNEALLALPLDLVSAQHLEGGSEAQLYLEHGGVRLDLAGKLEAEGPDDRRLWRRPVPNVLGVGARRAP